jgi:hypothetical protein
MMKKIMLCVLMGLGGTAQAASLDWSFGLTFYSPAKYVLGNSEIIFKQKTVKEVSVFTSYNAYVAPVGNDNVVLNSGARVGLYFPLNKVSTLEFSFGHGNYYKNSNVEYTVKFTGHIL